MMIEFAVGLLFMFVAGIAFMSLMVFGGLGFAAAICIDLYREKRLWFIASLLIMMALAVAFSVAFAG